MKQCVPSVGAATDGEPASFLEDRASACAPRVHRFFALLLEGLSRLALERDNKADRGLRLPGESIPLIAPASGTPLSIVFDGPTAASLSFDDEDAVSSGEVGGDAISLLTIGAGSTVLIIERKGLLGPLMTCASSVLLPVGSMPVRDTGSDTAATGPDVANPTGSCSPVGFEL
jgi:hypothetical protein